MWNSSPLWLYCCTTGLIKPQRDGSPTPRRVRQVAGKLARRANRSPSGKDAGREWSSQEPWRC
jgi:hypothetical protein